MLTKEELQQFKAAGYTITVSYDMTTFYTADVNPLNLENCDDTSDVEFENDEEESASFNDGSENYTIWSQQDQDGNMHAAASGLYTFDALESAIEKIVANLNHTKKD